MEKKKLIKKKDNIKEKLEEKVENIKEKVKNKKKKKKTGHKILIIVLILAIIFVLAILAGVVYIILSSPDFDTNKLYKKEATVLKLEDGTEFARLGLENRDIVSYEDLPQVLVDAIVATEDARFFQHQGFDIARFISASIGQVAGVSGAGGASTLTMQVVKNTYTSTEAKGIEGLIRKFTDIYMSIFKVEKKYTKEEIIEFYVNAPYLGARSHGVEQASQTYFGKSVRDLSLPEAAIIAGIFNAPYTLNPFYSIENCTKRRDRVLDLMYMHGYITEEQRDDAKSIPVESLITNGKDQSINKYQSFIDTVVEEVLEDTGLDAYSTPMEIITTLKPETQDVLNDLNAGKLYTFDEKNYPDVQIAIVVCDVNTGAMIAVDGRRDQTGERLQNLATSKDVRFQPGSTAKPIFAYGPLIEYHNASTGMYFFDDPYTYSNGLKFYNSDNSYHGIETMRRAISYSRNIPAVQAFQKADKAKIADFVHALGIDYGDELYEAYAIGGGVYANPKQMAAAYGTFARKGYYIEPYSYTKITFKDTNEILEKKPKKERVMSEETAYMVTSILESVHKTGATGNFNISGTDIAGKTGTSTYDYAALKKYNAPADTTADNWDITYSPDYVISLWYGYTELSEGHYTRTYPAHRARCAIMSAIAKKIYKKNSRFSKPAGVVEVEVEKETVPLQLPSAYTPADMKMTELFKVGTEPADVSTRYEKLENATNGHSSISGNSINLTWDPAPTPDAINPEKLKEHFTKENYYSDSIANKYYEQRIKYNNNNIGTLGYSIFIEKDGKETYVGYANSNSYTYNTNGVGGTYKFVIKTAYSIFKVNMSSGLVITVTTQSDPNNQGLGFKISNVIVNGGNDVTLSKATNIRDGGAYWQDTGLKITTSDDQVIEITKFDGTTNPKVTRRIINDLNQEVSSIDLTKAGEYNITYKVDGYDKELTRKIRVK